MARHAVLPVIDVDLFYFSDGFTYSSVNNEYKRTIWDVMIGLPLSRKGRWVLGWNYGSLTFSDSPGGTETSLTVSDMGPELSYYLNRDRTLEISFVYNIITKGTYNPGGDSTELRGTSMRVEVGYLPQITDSLLMGAKLNYYKATFNEEVTGQTTLSQVTHSRTVIYPSFAFTLRWD
ncbi:MAG: hypothetical protein HC902_13630 [Calothrix sp. SM1_5_4]|nr:hypothetical protein [Calothrix sp. SM1_5_4]